VAQRLTERGAEAGAPEKPSDLVGRSWWGALKRSLREYKDDNLSDWAAALTYYAVLALFPALLVLVAVVGLFGSYPETTNELLKIVRQVGPSSAVDTFRAPIEGVVRNKGGAGALLGFGLLGALWSASAYVGAFMRAANRVYEVEEGRPFWKLRPVQVLVTLAMVLGAAAVALAIVATGPLARAIGDAIGLGDTAVTVWNIGKWPVLAVVVVTMFGVLYYAAPNVRVRFRWLTPGGALAVVVWLVASGLFAFYAANFGSYNATYGALGGVIIFLVWMWITNSALLMGLEFNAELERSRELEAGQPGAEHDLQLPERDRPKHGDGVLAKVRSWFNSRRGDRRGEEDDPQENALRS
jgi:membrane protein